MRKQIAALDFIRRHFADLLPESQHVWLDPWVRYRWETSAWRYHLADKQSVEYFALCVGH